MDKKVWMGVVIGIAGAVLIAPKVVALLSLDEEEDTWRKMDKMESVDADEDEAEKGLTQLDSSHRADWQANGFPQTHAERERLEQESEAYYKGQDI
ncbi:hypothetical protein [Exiguobacterium algae]|uniref:hypothetical protein n=1 Tax=Exiguobacterium algae TaxID=2751250 RepID=UPI001BEBCB99|nr:hypothetical protein [Exiguobacterium algae]